MIRGDNDILSVMGELSSTYAGHDQIKKEKTTKTKEEAKATRIRLLPEIEGYDDDNQQDEDGSLTQLKMENSLNRCVEIWNPYVFVAHKCQNQSSSSTSQTITTLLPTNPDVEVIRRRCYEKFKTKFYAAFQFIALNINSSNNENHHNIESNNNSKQKKKESSKS